ncbi:Iojap family protein [Paucilactobacillus vaccinostercus DSM 20634]|jgi:ribosome-associated protein|uniref:Ribosomal silencing factor RsfS n=1 Tax=Paucilactobacillus vaccinostercus DSM 20634 TaxID=1423813 RepID=A0A0R2AH01_9LACO|nr:ribosome silencing factor [Paucilactobacillus vaccinostercus]KRM62140.1 Iojap family protein [Paucilactobacillus vaccinostercus DSM 20634]RRG09861.1 MAG: ribosome silencing factor [Lactobacillus sp.]
MESKEILELAVKAADSKRAEEIIALDVSEVSVMADYFVIMDANSKRQVQAIAEAVVEQAHKNDIVIKSVEGKQAGNWVLVDLGDVIVHVFQKDQRQFYNLEKLWSQAPMVNIDQWVEA